MILRLRPFFEVITMNMYDIMADLRSDSVKNIILDTDAYNEIDDQYAIAYAMLSGDKVNLLSINAAPFLNSRSTSAADGMEKSYNEIFNIRSLVNKDSTVPVYRGSLEFMKDKKIPVESEACENIIKTVTESENFVYVVAIGAITNVASAIVKCPDICKKMCVVWLGGHALHFPDVNEFNLKQDVKAAQIVFDSGVPLLVVPCNGVCTEFRTTVPELEYYLRGKNDLCDYLVDITAAYNRTGAQAWSKVIWDVTAVAALVYPESLDMVVMPRPYLTNDCRYAVDNSRPHFIYVRRINRDKLFADLFTKLANK